jgi:hypothetical protein
MALPSIYEEKTIDTLLRRLDNIKFDSKPKWGKMNAPQMLAHLNVAYDLAFGKVSSNNSFIKKFLLKLIVKRIVTNEKPYKQNSPTAPIFLVSSEQDFSQEKTNLTNNIKLVLSKGPVYFDGKDSDSFGPLTAIEWNNMFYKHLDHHFKQFGV